MGNLFQATAYQTDSCKGMFINVIEGIPRTIDGKEYVEIEPGNLRLRNETWRASRREALLDAAVTVLGAAKDLVEQYGRLLRGET